MINKTMRKIKYLLMVVALMTCCTASFAQSKTTKSKKETTTTYTQRKKTTTKKKTTTRPRITTTTVKPKITTTRPKTTSHTISKNNKNSRGTSWRMNVPTWKGFRLSFDHTFMSNKGPKPLIEDDYYLADEYGYIGSMNGFSIGYVQAIKLSPAIPLFLELGSELNYAKWSWSEDFVDAPDGYEDDPEYHYDITQSATAVSVRIPVNVVYAFKLNNNMVLKPYSGMFFRIYASAKYKFELDGDKDEMNLFKKNDFADYGTSDFDEEDKEFYDKNHWNRLVIGWTMGCDLDINQHFTVGLDFSYDTSRISESIRSSRLSLKVGYNL